MSPVVAQEVGLLVSNELTRAVAQRHTINPRTVLGFYATILVILLSGTCSLTIVLATTHTATGLIPWLLAACGFLVTGALVGIFYINIKHPANLMLGQITGMEYAEISRQVVLGNDARGERTVYIPTGSHDLLGQALPTEVATTTAIESGGADGER